MAMTPGWRKLVLVAHITTSVGWLGAVAAYVALDVAAVTSRHAETVRAAWLARDLDVWYVIVPLALASVVIGVVNALGTPWGLFRHYWVLVKLLLTLAATSILLQEAQSVSSMAKAAQSNPDPRPGSLSHSVGGLVVLITVATLSVYKPRGVTRYGWRKQQHQRGSRRQERAALVP
jgi:hypothetical protein